MMQTQIPQELSALMALSQGMQQGRVAPTTPDGAPTVAAQKMGQVEQGMMPGMQQAVGQAGLGAQIKAMQMQEAQKAMMNAAMQQAQPPAGIERLNPQMGSFAEGGIVGYAPGGSAASMLDPEQYALEIEMMNAEAEARRAARARRDDAERLAFLETAAPEVAARLKAQQAPAAAAPEVAAPPPPPPPRAPAVERQPSAARPSVGGGGIEELANKQRAIYASMVGPSTPEDAIAYELKRRPALDAYLRSQGVDPNYFEKRSEEDKALTEQQRALLRERMERERGRDTFLGRMGEALRGFSQMKGQGVGSGLTRSYDALSRRLEAGEARMDQMRDLEIKINELEINRRRSLEDAKRATMEGRVKDAEQSLNNANAFGNEIKKLTAATYPNQIQQMVELEKANAARDATRAGREAQDFARLQGIASNYEAKKVEALRKLDEDFAKRNNLLLQQEQIMKDKLPEDQKRALQTAREGHQINRNATAKQFDDRLAMINSRLYPGIDFSVGRAAPSANSSVEAARKIVSGSK